MRLGDNVLLVEGRRRVALYDMGRNKLMRAPHFVAELQTHHRPAARTTLSVAERKIVDKLLLNGYLQEGAEDHWEPYNVDSAAPSLSPLGTIIFDAREAPSHHLSSILEGDPNSFLIRHIIFVVLTNSEARTLAGLAMSHGLSFELATDSGGRLQSDIYSRTGKRVGTRRPLGTTNVKSYLSIDHSTVVLLQNYVESAGTLYIDAEGTVFPHFSEKHFALGSITSQSLEEILEGESYRRHIGNRKEVRQRCGGCELRLACLYSFVDRSDPNDITSEPALCEYDPDLESYQNALFL